MSHTPGPWRLAEIDLRPWAHRIRTDERNIADVFISEGEPETAGNANLIAAAPDMEEALDGIEGYAIERLNDLAADIQEGAVRGEWWNSEHGRWMAVVDALRKARGE